MNKEFVFLYPREEYIQGYFEVTKASKDRQAAAYSFVNQAILERYRSKSYNINWFLFSESEDDLLSPDTSSIDPKIVIENTDRLLPCGMTYDLHTTDKIYPNPAVMRTFLPKDSQFVLAGFHLLSCVDRLARFMYSKNIPVKVDEDLNEFTFIFDLRRGPQILSKYRRSDSKATLDFTRRQRSVRPWLTQIP